VGVLAGVKSKKSSNQSWSDYWSGTSSITKVSCRKTELKRCSDTDIDVETKMMTLAPHQRK